MASWQVSPSTWQSALVRAQSGATAGATIPVWVDQSGNPVLAPREHTETVSNTLATGVLIPLTVILVLGTANLTLRRILNRRRLAQWQSDWS